MVHPYGRILLSNRKEQTTAHGEGKAAQKCYTEEKKRYGRVQAARFNLHEIPEKAKRICNDRGWSSGCLGLRWETASKGGQRKFLGDGNVLYHDRGDGYEGCIYLSKLMEMYTQNGSILLYINLSQ